MSLMHNNVVKSGDYGVTLKIDTELPDFTGFTLLELEITNPDGGIVKTVTGADGGAGPVGRLITYVTQESDAVFTGNDGEWGALSRCSGAGVLRRGIYPVKIMVVA